MNLTKKFPCAKCGRYLTNIARHQRSCQVKENNRYLGRGVSEGERKQPTSKCTNCNGEFANIARHIKICKGPRVLKSCPFFCGKEVLSFNLERHKKSCKFNQRNICPLCRKVFKNITILENHIGVDHSDMFEQIVQQNGASVINDDEDLAAEAQNLVEDDQQADVQEIDATNNSREISSVTLKEKRRPKVIINQKMTFNYNYNYNLNGSFVKKVDQNLKVVNELLKLNTCKTCHLVFRGSEDSHECSPDIEGPQQI